MSSPPKSTTKRSSHPKWSHTSVTVESYINKPLLSPSSSPTSPSRQFVKYPPNQTPEPVRDLRGPITLHRLFLIFFVFSFIYVCVLVEDYFFPFSPDQSPYKYKWFARPEISVILMWQFLFYFATFLGYFIYRDNAELDKVQPIGHCVVWRIVTRGTNKDCLENTINRIRDEMKRNPLFPYLIEVVSDNIVFSYDYKEDVITTVVPKHYETKHKSKFKARALHYACDHSTIPRSSWIVHLDEESCPTSSSIKGIAAFVSKCEEDKNYHRIGQGCILYGRSWNRHPMLTLADMRRTGEDLGLYQLQCKLGYCIIGLHGSYVVMRAKEESQLGFDVGPNGSITEDAWWIFTAMQQGYRLNWIDGYLEEQSTQSLTDFLKQRQRWMYGVLKVVLNNPAQLRYLFVFTYFVFTWICALFFIPVQVYYAYIMYVHMLPIPLTVRVLSLLVPAMVVYTYMIGWFVNLREGMNVKRSSILPWTLTLLVGIPVFQFLENLSLISAFFAGYSSGTGFHVVKKSSYSSGKVKKDDALEKV